MAPRTRKLLLVLAAVAVLVSILLEATVPAYHGEGWVDYWWHHSPGFFAILGFAGCVLLVKTSKLLGKALLQRPEDYYGEADPDADEPDPNAGHPHEHHAHGSEPHAGAGEGQHAPGPRAHRAVAGHRGHVSEGDPDVE